MGREDRFFATSPPCRRTEGPDPRRMSRLLIKNAKALVGTHAVGVMRAAGENMAKLPLVEDALRNADSVNDLRLQIKLSSQRAKTNDLSSGTEHFAIV
jgi:hypothetical protein